MSAISRLVVANPGALTALTEVQRRLAVEPAVWLYPTPSLHVSLLGCTQRESQPQSPDSDRVQRIASAAANTLAELDPVEISVGPVNVIGTQLFVEVTTDDRRWADARLALDAELRAIGEEPLSYADPEPMHLNVARLIAEPSPAAFAAMLENQTPTLGHPILLGAVEVVVTDFVVSPETLKVVRTIRL